MGLTNAPPPPPPFCLLPAVRPPARPPARFHPQSPHISLNTFATPSHTSLSSCTYHLLYCYIQHLFPYTVDVLFFVGTNFRGQLSPNQFAGIQIRATSKAWKSSFYYNYQHISSVKIRNHISILYYYPPPFSTPCLPCLPPPSIVLPSSLVASGSPYLRVRAWTS